MLHNIVNWTSELLGGLVYAGHMTIMLPWIHYVEMCRKIFISDKNATTTPEMSAARAETKASQGHQRPAVAGSPMNSLETQAIGLK